MKRVLVIDQDDLSMMKNQDRWPRWPYLPVKNRGLKSDSGSIPRCGVLCQTDISLMFLDGKTLYDLAEVKPEQWTKVTAEQMIANGWVVD